MQSALSPLTAKRVALASLGLVIFFVVIGLILALNIFNTYLKAASTASSLSTDQLLNLTEETLRDVSDSEAQAQTWLILGVDALDNRPGHPVLTDTILLTHLKPTQTEINLLSLPRDLWDENYQTKINALYWYGQERYPGSPERFSAEAISELTGVQIDKSLVISLDKLATLIDLVGGVEIEVEVGFIDSKFPRDNVDISSGDPDVLYETVEFSQGTELMSGERALKYIRSRSSSDDEGTDYARGKRQQQVLLALLDSLTDRSLWLQPEAVGQLFGWYWQNYSQVVSLSDLGILAKAYVMDASSISLKTHQLSLFPDEEGGVIEHPNPRNFQNLWVYAIRDRKLFKDEISRKLGIE